MWLSSYPKFTVLLLPASIVDVPDTGSPCGKWSPATASTTLAIPGRTYAACAGWSRGSSQRPMCSIRRSNRSQRSLRPGTSDERHHRMFHRGHAHFHVGHTALDSGSDCSIRRRISITRYSVSSLMSVLPQDPRRCECITSRKAPRPRGLTRMALKQRRSELESTGRVSNYRPSNDRFPVVLDSTPV